MKNNWNEIKLEDYCDRITVGHVGSMANRYVSEGIPFLRSLNIKAFELDLKNLVYIDNQFNDALKKSQLKQGDVVVVRTGYPGTACVIPKNIVVANCSDLVIIRPGKNLDPYFIEAVFNSSWGKESVGGSTVGAAQQHFNIGTAKRMKFYAPDYNTQKRIGCIIKNYSEIIEVNNQRIKLLEESSRELYKEWFVRMRFPGHQKTKFVKGIPRGWSSDKIGNVTEGITRGISPAYDDDGNSMVLNQRCIRDNKIDFEPARKQNKIIPASKFLRKGDILINSTGEGTLGRTAQLNNNVDLLTVDSHVTIVRPKSNFSPEYLGLTIHSLEDHWESMALGSTGQTELSRKSIAEVAIKIPTKELLDKFSQMVSPVNQQIDNLLKQNIQLRQIRDRLLPRLISGKLQLKAFTS